MVNAAHEAADVASLGGVAVDACNAAIDLDEAVHAQQEGGHRNRHREAAAAARKAPQLSSHAEWAKHEHKLPEEALARVHILESQLFVCSMQAALVVQPLCTLDTIVSWGHECPYFILVSVPLVIQIHLHAPASRNTSSYV